MADDFPSRTLDKFVLRLPEGLRSRVKAAAAANNRSMNAEIVATLEETYPPEPTIEDLIDWAEMVISDFHDSPSYSGLKALRESLKELVQQLDAGKREGYPPTGRQAFLKANPDLGGRYGINEEEE